MCGIAGIFFADANSKKDNNSLQKMINTIIHRGPDAQNVWSAPGIGLGHARLSIIDLDERSNQPMVDSETGNVIVFNGEIYNYIELQSELIKVGYRFTTQSDTEVILKAYEHWGVNCLNKFNGMWSFVLYDAKKKNIFAARDRFGIKPFIYGLRVNGDFIFASEAKAIVAIFSEFSQPNMSFLIDFVQHDFFACYQETFYQGLYNLLPGHYFIIQHGEKPEPKRYWNWIPEIRNNIPKDLTIIEEFGEILQDAIRLRFRSDVPVGSCLSGGLDSTTIVGIASKLFNKQVSTFSCIYPDLPEFDESNYIKAAVNKFKTQAYYIVPKHSDYIQSVYDCIYEQDGPTGGPSLLSQRAVMSLAKQHVTVLLDGQGADEVLGGYHGYFHYSLLSNLKSLNSGWKIKAFLKYWNQIRQIKSRSVNVAPFLQIWLQARNPVTFISHKFEQTQVSYMNPYADDYLNTLLLEHVFTNLPNLLHYEDRNSMRFSLETRLPFLDYRLVEFAFSLPHSYKIRGKDTKWLLHQIARTILPKEILERKDKMGFTTPGHLWFQQNDNLHFFAKYMAKDNIIFRQISDWHKNYFERIWGQLNTKNFQVPAGEVNSLWRFFTANMWLEKLGK